MRVGIDGTNLGEGGGVTHLKEILINFSQENFKDVIKTVVVFSSDRVLKQLPDYEFIDKISFPNLNKSLLKRIWFQLTQYDKEIKQRCDILFSITGDYIGDFKPVVGMSQNMLLYERDIWKEIKQPKEILRFWLNFIKQKRCFSNAEGIIFISNYAKEYISSVINLQTKPKTIIYHGISSRFIAKVKKEQPIKDFSSKNAFKFLYVSTVHVYKHQWNVVNAIAQLRNMGYPVELHLVGGIIFKPSGEKLFKSIKKLDPENEFIFYHGNLPYEKIDLQYLKADGIIFASTCENMPNILIESMASGLPIACSDKQPMPEFLKENGYYFNAIDVSSIKLSLEKLLLNHKQNQVMSQNNVLEIQKYSWEITSEQTFNFLINIYNTYHNVQK